MLLMFGSMADRKKASLSKKLEMLRKTQEITEIVERGNIEEQALADSAGESRPADEDHVIDLLTNAQQQSRARTEIAMPRSKRKGLRRAKARRLRKPAKSSKPKKRGRR